MTDRSFDFSKRVAEALRGFPAGRYGGDFTIHGRVLPNGEIKVDKLHHKFQRSRSGVPGSEAPS